MKYFIVVLMSLVLVFAGCTQKQGGTTLVSFRGSKITDTEFKQKVQGLPKELQSVVLRQKKDFVEEMVNEQYLYQEAKKRNIQNQAEVKDLIESAREKIIIAKLIEEEVDKKATLDPDEAQKYYEAHKDQFMTPLLLRASHILVKTEAEASEIKAKLDAGADFEELARTKSIDNTSVRGGDLGFFQKGQLVPEFEEAAFKLQKGEINSGVKTQFGYHIIKLTDKAEPALRDLKMVQAQLEKQILNGKRAAIFRAFVQKLRGNDKVEINEKVLESVTVG